MFDYTDEKLHQVRCEPVDGVKLNVMPTIEDFDKAMENHWMTNLNAGGVNDRLRKSWNQLNSIMVSQIENHGNPFADNNRLVLSTPTGVGKSEGMVSFCAKLSYAFYNYEHPGVLIVTRLIKDCNSIAERINRFGECDTAIACHSESRDDLKKSDTMKTWPVLVITHRAYELALGHYGKEFRLDYLWSRYHDYMIGRGKQRKLLVIDEAMDSVEHHVVKLSDLRRINSLIPVDILGKYPEIAKMLNSVIALLLETAQNKGQLERIFTEQIEPYADIDISPLVKALRGVRWDHADGEDDLVKHRRLLDKVEKTFSAVDLCLKTWSLYGKRGNLVSLNTGSIILPPNVKGGVLMDAMGPINIGYELDDNVTILDAPEGVRDYSNFTLHCSTGHTVGKTFMIKNAREVVDNIIPNLNGQIEPDSKTLIVCHKAVKPLLTSRGNKVAFDMRIGTWGAVTGSNDWRECDNVVIMGLPYLPHEHSAITYMTLRNIQSDKFLKDPKYREYGIHGDIRKALEINEISANVIQAINRISIRNIVRGDSHGRCAKAHGYILLPAERDVALAILDNIRKMMPGIKTVEWKYEHQKCRQRGSKFIEGFIELLPVLLIGRFSPTQIAKKLGTSVRTIKRQVIPEIKLPDSDLSKAMVEAGVEYKSVKYGKTYKKYFVKR